MKKRCMFDAGLKGFMLVETLLVSLTISGILVYMYAQFSTINNAYQSLYEFNTASSLYRASAFSEFLMYYTKENSTLYSGLTAKKIQCTDIISKTDDRKFCEKIYTAMDVNTIILTLKSFDDADVLDLVTDVSIKTKLRKFLATIKKQSGNDKYRLITIFKDGTIATVLFEF